MIVTMEGLAGDRELRSRLEHELNELFRSANRAPAGSPPRYAYQYLEVLGTRA